MWPGGQISVYYRTLYIIPNITFKKKRVKQFLKSIIMFYPLPTEIPMRLYEPREEYRYLRLVSLIMDIPENIETSLVFG